MSSYVDQLNRAEQKRGRLSKAGAFAIGIAIVVGVVLAVISLSANDKGGGAGGGGGGSVQSSVPGYQQPGPGVANNETIGTSSRSSCPLPPPPRRRRGLRLTILARHVQLNFDDVSVPDGYRLPVEMRGDLITYLEKMLPGYLEEPLKLVEVAYARDEVTAVVAHDGAMGKGRMMILQGGWS